MIVTVLWEDQRAAGKGFGPHELLVSCLADELATEASTLKKRVRSHPKKGNAKVLADLKLNAARLRNSGPLFAVIDRDKVRKLWSAADAPTDCLSGLGKHFHRDAPGDYELVFLIQNVESLLDIAADVLGEAKLRSKPSPDLPTNATVYSSAARRSRRRFACGSGRVARVSRGSCNWWRRHCVPERYREGGREEPGERLRARCTSSAARSPCGRRTTS